MLLVLLWINLIDENQLSWLIATKFLTKLKSNLGNVFCIHFILMVIYRKSVGSPPFDERLRIVPRFHFQVRLRTRHALDLWYGKRCWQYILLYRNQVCGLCVGVLLNWNFRICGAKLVIFFGWRPIATSNSSFHYFFDFLRHFLRYVPRYFFVFFSKFTRGSSFSEGGISFKSPKWQKFVLSFQFIFNYSFSMHNHTNTCELAWQFQKPLWRSYFIRVWPL